MREFVRGKDNNEYWAGLILVLERLSGDHDERTIFSRARRGHERLNEIILRKGSESGAENTVENTLSSHITARWKECFYEYSLPVPRTTFSLPPHMLCVGGVADDTALPGLEVKWEEHTISVIWKEMLSSLFGEDEYFREVLEAREMEMKKNKIDPENHYKFPPGSTEHIEARVAWILRHDKMVEKAHLGVRGRRFRRLFESDTDLAFEEQPDNINKAKVLRQYGWVGTYGFEYEDEWGLEG